MSVYQKFIDSSATKQPTAKCSRMLKNGSSTTMIKHQPATSPQTLPIVYSSGLNPARQQQQQHHRRLFEAERPDQTDQEMTARQRCCNLSCYQQQQHPVASQQKQLKHSIKSIFKTDDPVLLKWLQAMRFETELECLTSLQARTLAIDERSAGALSIRNSQVSIQEMRLQSNFILDYIDYLIESLPLTSNNIGRFNCEFSELWTRLVNQTAAQTAANQLNSTTLKSSNQNNLTIINCTPRKSKATIKSGRQNDKLALQIRDLCIEFANLLYQYQDDYSIKIENDQLESTLRRLKELYGKFIEISIRAECANIVRALDYDFSQSSLNRLSSSSSLPPVRPFESSSEQLPLKWALIALWQLTKDDSYLCRTLTEKWEWTVDCPQTQRQSSPPNRVAKRLDYSTKYDQTTSGGSSTHSSDRENYNSLRSDYQRLYQICQQNNSGKLSRDNDENDRTSGALSSALKSRQQQPIKQVSTIELLIDIIVSQPNRHERLDVMNFIHSQARLNKLIDLDEWDQSFSAAIYTSNQYKVAALRILNHLCINEQAVKTILKCFSTPPPSQGQAIPENKIIRSIFECYQTSQEHIYQNETMLSTTIGSGQRGRKRTRQQQQQQMEEAEEYSDYGSRQTTNSVQTSASQSADEDESEDVVVKEAIRLLVQLTTYFHRSNQGLDFYTLIGRFSIDSLVKYLTNIIKLTTSREMLFLSLTALANISFITTEPMKLYGTNRIMLEMFRASKSRSKDLELRDQAVTILANTADKNLLDVVSNGGLTFLLSCFESCPTRMANYRQLMDRLKRDPLAQSEDGTYVLNIENKPRDRKPIDFREDFPDVLDCACDQQSSQVTLIMHQQHQIASFCLSRLTQNDLAALERIHQKTAVAFARMSADPSTTRMVLKYGGVKKMIDLCKFSHKRNHSDTVLIACIAALRKMAKVIDSDTFKHYNALDLIELELNQALEIYGAPRERQLYEGGQQRLFASDV